VLLVAAPASAHVTVNPSTATQGGYAKLTFRVPTERDDASTTRLQVFFPTNHPLASVSVKPHVGWDYVVKTEKLAKPITTDDGQVTQAVSEISWTAKSPADAIKPGQFDEFDVSAGPLPSTSTLTFKALQTYSDGQVVRWIEPRVAGAAEPVHPAPVLTLLPAGDDAATSASPSKPLTSSSNGRATTALVLGIVALVVALGGAATALVTQRRNRATG
jgi:uncharacterized protein YcnI